MEDSSQITWLIFETSRSARHYYDVNRWSSLLLVTFVHVNPKLKILQFRTRTTYWLCSHYIYHCNCNYILFTKLPWPGDSEGTFRSSSQATTCLPVYHTRRRLHTVPFNAEGQAGKLWIPIFMVFGLTRPGIEPESTASVADALSTRPLIG